MRRAWLRRSEARGHLFVTELVTYSIGCDRDCELIGWNVRFRHSQRYDIIIRYFIFLAHVSSPVPVFCLPPGIILQSCRAGDVALPSTIKIDFHQNFSSIFRLPPTDSVRDSTPPPPPRLLDSTFLQQLQHIQSATSANNSWSKLRCAVCLHYLANNLGIVSEVATLLNLIMSGSLLEQENKFAHLIAAMAVPLRSAELA